MATSSCGQLNTPWTMTKSRDEMHDAVGHAKSELRRSTGRHGWDGGLVPMDLQRAFHFQRWSGAPGLSGISSILVPIYANLTTLAMHGPLWNPLLLSFSMLEEMAKAQGDADQWVPEVQKLRQRPQPTWDFLAADWYNWSLTKSVASDMPKSWFIMNQMKAPVASSPPTWASIQFLSPLPWLTCSTDVALNALKAVLAFAACSAVFFGLFGLAFSSCMATKCREHQPAGLGLPLRTLLGCRGGRCELNIRHQHAMESQKASCCASRALAWSRLACSAVCSKAA